MISAFVPLLIPTAGGGAVTTFATWNPADKNSGVTLSGGNLVALTTALAGFFAVRATIGKSAGKWYWEVKPVLNNPNIGQTGLADGGFPLSDYVGQTFTSYGYSQSGNVYTNGAILASASSYTNSDTAMFAVDLDNAKMWVGKNGVWFNSGNPATGAASTFSLSLGSAPFYPAYSNSTSGRASQVTANFGASAFSFSVPSGFNGGWFQ